MAGSDLESGEGVGVVEEDNSDPQQVGGEAAGVRLFLQRRCSVSVTLWYGDMGGEPFL